MKEKREKQLGIRSREISGSLEETISLDLKGEWKLGRK